MNDAEADEILTPRCPLCDGAPYAGLTGILPWFCGNDDCSVLTWEPYKTLDENLMNAGPVKITGSDEEE